MVVYVVAIILGVLFSVRRLEVRKREAEHFPSVKAEDFLTWQSAALVAYSAGAGACFLLVLFDVAFRFSAERLGLSWSAIRIGGATIFLSWVAALVWSWRRSRAARDYAGRVGIDLRQPIPDPDPRAER